MKVPPKRKGNASPLTVKSFLPLCLNESPSEKEGKVSHGVQGRATILDRLNESPSEKEGKYARAIRYYNPDRASMKVPPKRKGNQVRNSRRAILLLRLNESPSEKEGK